MSLPTAPGPVLSTLNEDGTRRWIRPRLSHGKFLTRRRVFGWFLILLFAALPYVTINGKPAILLDIVAREFTLFGTTFLATDTLFLMLFMVGIIASVFLLTALFGRIWCGWACPQTVYMELLFRPLEVLIEGGRNEQLRMDRQGPDFRRAIKIGVFFLVSLFVSHVFLSYFVGVSALFQWVQSSPAQHPVAFTVMSSVTLLMFLDFLYFREQTCLVACPYGRLQSVLLDRQSLIVGYDSERGEPRGKRRGSTDIGDCVDCKLCVQTCPTGIDIRNGLQMECINCTQCIDACDQVMDKVGKPRGLIRYSSQDELAGKPRRLLRARVLVYPVIVLAVFGLLGVTIATKASADITVLRGLSGPYTMLPDGLVSNQVRLKIVNRSDQDQEYLVVLDAQPDLNLIVPQNPAKLAAGETKTLAVFVTAPRSSFENGKRNVSFIVSDRAGFEGSYPYVLLGPYSSTNTADDRKEE